MEPTRARLILKKDMLDLLLLRNEQLFVDYSTLLFINILNPFVLKINNILNHTNTFWWSLEPHMTAHLLLNPIRPINDMRGNYLLQLTTPRNRSMLLGDDAKKDVVGV
jgi:hypothetical protein